MGLKKILIGITALFFVAIIGYDIYDTSNQDFEAIQKQRDNPSAEEKQIPPLANGTPAPAFTLKDRTGKSYSLQEFQNKKRVLVEFFNPFCPHCQKSTPFLNFIQENLTDEVQIISISTLPDSKNGKATEVSGKFADVFSVKYPILEYPSEEMIKSYKIQGVPLSYLVDLDGKIIWSHLGTFNQAAQFELEKQLSDLGVGAPAVKKP